MVAKNRKGRFVLAVGSILLCEAVGIVSSVFTFSSIPGWYAYLAKPSFTPPSWVFGPAWTLLYALMGLSLYFLLVDRRKDSIKMPGALFGIQLALNFLWTAIFFGAKSISYGLLEIAVLWVGIFATMISFYKVSRRAALMLLPYLAWVTFAMLLNLYVWKLN